MLIERIDCPVMDEAEIVISGRYACVMECGLAAEWSLGVDRGMPVIGGQIIDTKLMGSKQSENFLRLKGTSLNALGLRHRIAVASSDSLEELRTIQPRPFSPYSEITGTAPGAAAFSLGDHFEILTPGNLSLWVKTTYVVPGPGAFLTIMGADALPMHGPADIEETFNDLDAAGGLRLRDIDQFTHVVLQAPLPAGLYRLVVNPLAAGDVFTVQMGMIGI